MSLHTVTRTNNFCGICLLSITGKLFARVTLNRHQVLAEKLYPESKLGLQACRSSWIKSRGQASSTCAAWDAYWVSPGGIRSEIQQSWESTASHHVLSPDAKTSPWAGTCPLNGWWSITKGHPLCWTAGKGPKSCPLHHSRIACKQDLKSFNISPATWEDAAPSSLAARPPQQAADTWNHLVSTARN